MDVAKELKRVSKHLVATEFKSPDALNKYLREHPNADRGKHTVKKSPGKAPSKAPAKSTEVSRHRKVTPSVRSMKKVNNVMKANKLSEESDEVAEMMGFKKTLGQRVPEAQKGQYYVRNEAKLRADFLKNMNPSNYDSPEAFKAAKERIKKMPTSDFGKVLAAISEEDEPVQASTEGTMNRTAVAKELMAAARLLLEAGEVPEAFKKEWKNKDKDDDGKENEPKPDFLKKKEKASIADELHAVAKMVIEAGEVPEAFKKQWKNKGKDDKDSKDDKGEKDDKKDNKPPWLKKKK